VTAAGQGEVAGKKCGESDVLGDVSDIACQF
jgi:hypothetical protein